MTAFKSKMHERLQALTHASAPNHPSCPVVSGEIEEQLIALIMRPIPITETSLAGNARKEHEIAALFAGLSIVEAWTLHKRLSIASPDDRLVAVWGRLVAERRSRLLAFLGDARRRAAIARAA